MISMSTIKVEVTAIQNLRPHNNADTLELATVGGWQICVKKGMYHNNDQVVYFEQGTVIPKEVADRLGVTQYLSEKTDINGQRVLVIHRVKLRGEPSFGLVITPEPGMQLGQDVAEFYSAVKFSPPVKITQQHNPARFRPEDPRFPAYTDIENMRSYSTIFTDGEEVIATEKIHGTNSRVGFIRDIIEGETKPVKAAGSRKLQRPAPENNDLQHDLYWTPHSIPSVANLLEYLIAQNHQQAVIYGEIYGKGIQPYTYGMSGVGFRAFDIMINGIYLNYDDMMALCSQYGIETVPLIYRGPFSLDKMKELSEGASLIGGKHGREGVVVKPVIERQHPKLGRVILKYVGDAYLFSKVAEQDTTDV